MEKDGQTINIETDHVIALCHILDDFKEFDENVVKCYIRNYTRTNYGPISLKNLIKLVKKQDVLFDNKTKKFYKKNLKVIEEISKHTYISNFLIYNYNYYQSRCDLHTMFNYIMRNRDNLDNILAVLNRLKELGFNSFEFDENRTFDENIYKYELGFSPRTKEYLDGDIKVFPTYDDSKITFQSKGANYLMELNCLLIKRISSSGNTITLNNLTFDVDNLPNYLTFNETIQKIIDLKKVNENVDKFIRNAVDLDYVLMQLDSSIKKLGNIIGNLDEVKDQEKGIEHISNIKNSVKGIAEFIKSYEEQELIEQNMNEESLEEEKRIHNKRNEPSIIIKKKRV